MLRRAAPLLPLVVAFVVYYAAYDHNQLVPTGDEPFYILEAHSLVDDGDRDLRNQLADRALIASFYPGRLSPTAQVFAYTSSPRRVTAHHVGLPVLIAAPVALNRRVKAIRIELIVISAFAAWLLWSLLRSLRIAGTAWTAAVWAAVAFSAPLVLYSSQIYPEIPAATLVLLALRMLVVARPRTWQLAICACALAALPWLHVRYLMLAAPLAIALVLRARGAAPDAPRRAWWTLAPLGVSLLAMAVAFQAWYGSPLLNAQYQSPPVPSWYQSTDLSFVYVSGLGSLLGPQIGWLPVAPVAILAVPATVLVVDRYRWWGALGVAGAFAYVALTLTAYIGYSFPARYLVPVMPLAAIPLLLAVRMLWPVRIAFVALALLGLALARDAALHPLGWYPDGSGYLGTSLGRKIHAAWPDLVPDPSVVERAANHYPDGALTALWIGGLAFVAMLMLAAVRNRIHEPDVATGASETM